MAATSAAQLKAVKKYRAANYETISFEVKRGCREEFKAKAAAMGMTLAGFFKTAAEAYAAEYAIILPKGEGAMATNQEYKDLNYDRLAVWIPKGRRAEFKEKAAAMGLSLAQLIQRAVGVYGGEGIPTIYSERTEAAQNQPVSTNEQTIKPAAEGAQNRITGADKRLLAAVNALPPESKKTLLKFLESLQG